MTEPLTHPDINAIRRDALDGPRFAGLNPVDKTDLAAVVFGAPEAAPTGRNATEAACGLRAAKAPRGRESDSAAPLGGVKPPVLGLKGGNARRREVQETQYISTEF